MNKYAFAGLGLALLAGSAPAAHAQTPGSWGSWFIAAAELPGSAEHRWGGFAEVQVRTDAPFHEYFYNELKGGVSYNIDNNFALLLGGGRYATYDKHELGDGPLNVEKRLWQQLLLVQYASRLKLEHRYRIEQRWLRFRDESTDFRQRLRYRLNAFLPLNAPKIQPGTVFLSAYDEIFLNPKGPVFERNRIYAGLGYQASTHFIVQAGWVNQANFSTAAVSQGQPVPASTAAKNNVVLSLIYRLSRSSTKAAPEVMPSQQD
jgi:hypothetical protein